MQRFCRGKISQIETLNMAFRSWVALACVLVALKLASAEMIYMKADLQGSSVVKSSASQDLPTSESGIVGSGYATLLLDTETKELTYKVPRATPPMHFPCPLKQQPPLASWGTCQRRWASASFSVLHEILARYRFPSLPQCCRSITNHLPSSEAYRTNTSLLTPRSSFLAPRPLGPDAGGGPLRYILQRYTAGLRGTPTPEPSPQNQVQYGLGDDSTSPSGHIVGFAEAGSSAFPYKVWPLGSILLLMFPNGLALPRSGPPTILKLTCRVRGEDRQLWTFKSPGSPNW